MHKYFYDIFLFLWGSKFSYVTLHMYCAYVKFLLVKLISSVVYSVYSILYIIHIALISTFSQSADFNTNVSQRHETFCIIDVSQKNRCWSKNLEDSKILPIHHYSTSRLTKNRIHALERIYIRKSLHCYLSYTRIQPDLIFKAQVADWKCFQI